MKDRVPLYVMVDGHPTEGADDEVPGNYLVMVDADLSERDQVSAALDVFHSSVAIECLDDFSISVIDESGAIRDENEEHESYSLPFEKRGEFCGPVDDADMPSRPSVVA